MIAREVVSENEWEEFIGVKAPQSLFAGWMWGNVERAMGHTVKRIGWYEGKSLVALAQLIVVAGRRGRMLHARHGPILGKWDKKTFADVKNECLRIAREENCAFLRMSPLTQNPETPGVIRDAGFREAPIHGMDAQRCLVLDLGKTDAELLAGMRKSTRYDIRKAENSGVIVKSSTSADALRTFLGLYDRTANRQGFVEHTGIAEEVAEFGAKNRCEILTAYVDGRATASAVILYYQDQGIYHHGASLVGGIPSSPLVQWEAIRRSRARGCRWYNFWGIAPADRPDHPWKGLSLFKRGFGGNEYVYPSSFDFPIGAGYYLMHGLELWRKRTKGY